MFRKNYIAKINLPGGIVAAGDLYAIVDAAERARVEEMQFGGRQQLFCKVADRYGEEFLRGLEDAGIFYETEKECYPNIISSYVTEGVFGKSQWVSEGLYKDILGAFDFRPRLKVNLVDAGQSFVPFLTGHLNFISSPVNNHWHLVLREPGTNRMHQWPTGIYSPDIPRISRAMEEWLIDGSGGNGLGGSDGMERIKEIGGRFREGPHLPEVRLPPFQLPYYEGFNRAGNKSWLGIYRREELFPLAFLKDVCLVALQTKNGQLYTTPWKSLLIKDIEDQDMLRWEYVLGKYRMNVRHASNELNWQIEDLCADGLRLKRYLVRQLDQDDVRTEGLSFTIKTQKGSGLAGSVIIRLQDAGKPGQHKALDRYSIWHTEGFDAHARESVLYRKDLEKEHLFPYLVSLCKAFYEQQSDRHEPILTVESGGGVGAGTNRGHTEGFQCRDCLTLYDEQYGDPDQAVLPGTPFGRLGEDYVCPVCGAPKTDFGASVVTLA
jgi:rubredoxin